MTPCRSAYLGYPEFGMVTIGQTIEQTEILDLVIKAREGDKPSILRLHGLLRLRFLSFFRRRIGHKEDSEDLTQLALIASVARLNRFRNCDSKSSFDGWVHSIAYFILGDYFRKGRKRQWVQLNESLLPSDPARLDDDICKKEFHAIVLEELERIPSVYQQALQLHLQGLDNFEIAKTLDIEYNTARSRISRGLSRLQRNLKARGL